MKTALIIGAGPAGLTAAHRLLAETDIKPIVLEESEDIGGISKTLNHNGNRIDMGGHRFFSKIKEVNDFWNTMLPLQGAPSKDDAMPDRKITLNPGGPDPEKEDKVMLVRKRVSRIFYLRKFFDYPITLKFQTLANLGFFRSVYAGIGYVFSAVFKKKERSLEDFMINRFGRPLYNMFFRDYNIKLWGVSPAEMAPDWGAQRIKGLSLFKAVLSMLKSALHIRPKHVETSLIEEFYYPKLGPGQMWETVADEIVKKGGEIQKNARVCGVMLDADHRIRGVRVDRGGRVVTMKADYYISSMPVKDLIEAIPPGPAVPDAVRQTAAGLPYRDFVTVGLLVDKLLLKNPAGLKTVSGIVPDTWIYIQERDVRMGRLQIFNNWSPYMVKDPENTVWIGLEYFGLETEDFWTMPDNDFIEMAIDELVKMRIITKDAVRDAVRIKIKKAYPGYFGAYRQFGVVRDYLDSIDNLYCIGRNGQHRYNNMDHSMMTAFECVNNIKYNIRDRSNIWNVNTEQDYLESRKIAEKDLQKAA